MPFSINRLRMAGEQLAGPMVHTILAFRMVLWKPPERCLIEREGSRIAQIRLS